jgi:hypothetical protein
MSSARDLLRQARFRQSQTEERIAHPLCSYNALGAPTCRACRGVKLDSNAAWSIHVESASHKRNAIAWNQINSKNDGVDGAAAQVVDDESSPVTTAADDSVTTNHVTIDETPIVKKKDVMESAENPSSNQVTATAAMAQLPAGFFDPDVKAEEEEKAARLDAEFAEFAEAVRDKLEATGDADLVADAAVAVASDLEQSQSKILQLEALKSRFKRARQDAGGVSSDVMVKKKPNATKPTTKNNDDANDNDDDDDELSDLDAWRRRG